MLRSSSAPGPGDSAELEDILKREWSSCLRRIQKDSASNDESSVAVFHMTNMISDVLGSIRKGSWQGADSSSGRGEPTRGEVPLRDKYEELIEEVVVS